MGRVGSSASLLRAGRMKILEALNRVEEADGDTLDLAEVGSASTQDFDALASIGFALLASSGKPAHLVLPEKRAARIVLARTGVIFAASLRGLALRLSGQAVSPSTALVDSSRILGESPLLPGFDWKRFDDLLTDQATVDDPLVRLRVVSDLADTARRPPQLDDQERRYRWIDNLGATTSLDSVAAQRFNADADQVLFEAVDNVHEWSRAVRAMACCAVTRGGGGASHDRLHILIADDGVGVGASVTERLRKQGLDDWQNDDKVRKFAAKTECSPIEAMLHQLVSEARHARLAQPLDPGQGLHAVGLLSGQWHGSFCLMTGDGTDCTWVRRVGEGKQLEMGTVSSPVRGTMIHVTLNARPEAAAEVLESQLTLVAAP